MVPVDPRFHVTKVNNETADAILTFFWFVFAKMAFTRTRTCLQIAGARFSDLADINYRTRLDDTG